MAQRQVAARRQGRHQRRHDGGGPPRVPDERQGRRQQQRRRPPQVQRLGRPGQQPGRVGEPRVQRHQRALRRRLRERPHVREHHRVVVHVHHPAGRVDRLRQITAGLRARQPRPDVDELPDPRLDGQEPHRPLMKRQHPGHDRRQRRRRPQHRQRRPPISLEAIPPPVQEIRHPRRIGRQGIDPLGLRPPGRVKLPVVDHRAPVCRFPATPGHVNDEGRPRGPPSGRPIPTPPPPRMPDVPSPLTSPVAETRLGKKNGRAPGYFLGIGNVADIERCLKDPRARDRVAVG